MLPLPLSLLSLASLSLLPSFSTAAALPRQKASVSTTQSWCTPRFSGLVQEIRKSGQADIVWRAVASKAGNAAAIDGVKAAKVGKSRSASLELEYEWFVEGTDKEGIYTITSGAAPSTCLTANTPPNPLEVQAQHAFSPASSNSARSCAPSHAFRLLCESCDPHEDSATSCFVHSLTKGLCVELVPAPEGSKNSRARLGWGECAWDGEEGGWKGRAEKDKRRERQLWSISPS
ncbi:hypothetical protein JCM11641_000902 [Rhodosporidiobolus odoratus]